MAGFVNKINYKGTEKEISPYVEITYSNLVSLRNSSGLTPGQSYRITDYVTTTSQNSTHSAGHQFDIIVVADSVNKLNEKARACLHSGDTYFSGSTVDAWEIWYCLDNDTNRFMWADTSSGKGVIYRMIDEWGNDCPYDFKNIQFPRYKITSCPKSPDLEGLYSINGVNGITVDTSTTYWCYTFSMINLFEDVIDDLSVFQNKYPNDKGFYYKQHNNVFKPYYYDDYDRDPILELMSLPNNVFVTDTDICSIADDYSYGEFYGFYSNTFGNECYYNTFGNSNYRNTFGNNCRYNTFGNSNYRNTFGNNCRYNTFGNNCGSNTFGNNCYSNTFGNNCGSNIFGNDCYSNTFGNNCRYNTFGNDCYSNTFGNYFQNNTFGKNCYYNTFGNGCVSNTFGNGCGSNTFGNECYYNTFGNDCRYNTFGNNCRYNTFGNGCNNIRYQKDYTWYTIVENGNQYITVTSTQTTSDSNKLRNFIIGLGYNNITTTVTISHNTVNDTTRTLYTN